MSETNNHLRNPKEDVDQKDQVGTPFPIQSTFDSNRSLAKCIFKWPNGYWDHAVPHDLIRGELLSAAEERWAWADDQPSGLGLNDRTSPHPEQLSWAWEPCHYPEIIFVLRKNGYRTPAYEAPFWYHRGRLVLDHDSRPMRKFRHLPDVCSSRLPGGHIEALMRLDDRTTYRDLYGRMPKEVVAAHKEGPCLKPLRDIRSLIASARRFRERAGCLNWGDHLGIDTTNRLILMNLPEELKARNTTRGWQASGKWNQQAKLSKRDFVSGVSSKRGVQLAPAQISSWRLQRACFSDVCGDSRDSGSMNPSCPDVNQDEDIDDDQDEKFDPQLDVEISDSRRDYPEDDSAILDLRSALTATFTDFFHKIGRLPISYPNLSYVEQYKKIQQEFDDACLSIRSNKQPSPMLIQLTYWTGGISNWRSACFWDGRKAYQIDENGEKGCEILPECEEARIRWSEDEMKRSPFDPHTFECGSALFDSTGVPIHPRTQNYGRNLSCWDGNDSSSDKNRPFIIWEDDWDRNGVSMHGVEEDDDSSQPVDIIQIASPAGFRFEFDEGYDKENLHRGSTAEAAQRIWQGGVFYSDDGRLSRLEVI